jgi:hypothetical protein
MSALHVLLLKNTRSVRSLPATSGNTVVNKLTRNVDSLTADLFYFSRYYTE